MKEVITLRLIQEAVESKQADSANIQVQVDGHAVYDYKDLDGKFILMHEPIDGWVPKKEGDFVYLNEILKEEWLDLPVVSETYGSVWEAVLTPADKKGRRIVNFRAMPEI